MYFFHHSHNIHSSVPSLETKDSAISLTLPIVTKEVCPGGKIKAFFHFLKDMTVYCFHENGRNIARILSLCQLQFRVRVLLTFAHFQSFYRVTLNMFNFHFLCQKRKKKKGRLFIWICDVLFKQNCSFVYLNILLSTLQLSLLLFEMFDTLSSIHI